VQRSTLITLDIKKTQTITSKCIDLYMSYKEMHKFQAISQPSPA